jgi:hypothetical protein
MSSSIAKWNMEFESGSEWALPSEAWDMWLWGSDMHEPVTPRTPLSRNHLLGILIARYRGRYRAELMRVRLGDLFPDIVHGTVIVPEMTLRQLRDSVEDIQMHWEMYTQTEWESASLAVDALMTRFGEINLAAGSPALRDDPSSHDTDRPGWMSPAALRRFASLFCVLYRHLHLAAVSSEVVPAVQNTDVHAHHVQAGVEEFYRHGMLADLPPAARIIYKMDFQGMYHCVTQVVYMHFPSYERRRQVGLEEIRSSSAAPVHTLSVLLQVHPEAHMVFEDDGLRKGWNWVFLSAGGLLYLVHCPGEAGESAQGMRVWSCACVWTLLEIVRVNSEALGSDEVGL